MRTWLCLAIAAGVWTAACSGDDGPAGGRDSGASRVDSGGEGEGEDGGGEGEDAGGEGEDAGDDAGTADAGMTVDAGMMCGAAGAMGCAPGGPTTCCAGAGLMCCVGVPDDPGGTGTCRLTSMCGRSDRNIKHGFASIEPEEVLARVASLEISTWSYDDDPGVRHMGPMAQDFSAAFELGDDDRHIHVIDMNGVSTAAIQALHARTERLASENEALRRDNVELREAVRRIEARIGGGR